MDDATLAVLGTELQGATDAGHWDHVVEHNSPSCSVDLVHSLYRAPRTRASKETPFIPVRGSTSLRTSARESSSTLPRSL